MHFRTYTLMEATKIEYLSKEDAAKRLGLKVRTVLELAAGGKLRSRKTENTKTRRAVVELHAGDVERLRDERVGDAKLARVRAAVKVNPEARAMLGGRPTNPLAALVGARPIAEELGPWLTLEECEKVSKLPASYLRELVLSGELPARDVGVRAGGQWRVHRDELLGLRGVKAIAAVSAQAGV